MIQKRRKIDALKVEVEKHYLFYFWMIESEE